jgi:hypothetical protein
MVWWRKAAWGLGWYLPGPAKAKLWLMGRIAPREQPAAEPAADTEPAGGVP